MLGDLSLPQQRLAAYMSALSELAFCAGWMEGLEFSLWKALTDGPCRFGQIDLTHEQLSRLRELSEECNGWIYFDNKQEESFASLADWRQLLASAGPRV